MIIPWKEKGKLIDSIFNNEKATTIVVTIHAFHYVLIKFLSHWTNNKIVIIDAIQKSFV